MLATGRINCSWAANAWHKNAFSPLPLPLLQQYCHADVTFFAMKKTSRMHSQLIRARRSESMTIAYSIYTTQLYTSSGCLQTTNVHCGHFPLECVNVHRYREHLLFEVINLIKCRANEQRMTSLLTIVIYVIFNLNCHAFVVNRKFITQMRVAAAFQVQNLYFCAALTTPQTNQVSHIHTIAHCTARNGDAWHA